MLDIAPAMSYTVQLAFFAVPLSSGRLCRTLTCRPSTRPSWPTWRAWRKTSKRRNGRSAAVEASPTITCTWVVVDCWCDLAVVFFFALCRALSPGCVTGWSSRWPRTSQVTQAGLESLSHSLSLVILLQTCLRRRKPNLRNIISVSMHRNKKKSASRFKCFTNFQPFIFLRGLQCEQPDMAHYPQKVCLALCLQACSMSSVLCDKIISSTKTCALIRHFLSWIHWPLTPTGPNCLTAFCYVRL